MSKTLKIKPKKFTRAYLKENGHLIFRNRELIIEEEGEGDKLTLRFKVGDGTSPYSALQYVSSLYGLFPNVFLFDKEYNNGIELDFGD